tara:strand:+ start:729 stop:2081 length:1353 start_codon:yes stop_codon:yes gene_type:complete
MSASVSAGFADWATDCDRLWSWCSYPSDEDPVPTSCSDSDGGKNIEEKGITEAGSDSREDECYESELVEFFCTSNKVNAQTFDCVEEGYEGCSSGACANYEVGSAAKKVDEGGCSDSDGGKNIEEKGTTIGVTLDGYETIRSDLCTVDTVDSSDNSYDMLEYYCSEENIFSVELINCGSEVYNGCSDGACVNYEVGSATKKEEVREEDAPNDLDEAVNVDTSSLAEITKEKVGEITLSEDGEENECSDGEDNDGDGSVDTEAGCYVEEGSGLISDCGDRSLEECSRACEQVGGYFHLADSGCSVSDDSEYNRCGDGVDNDNDGLVDFYGGCDVDEDRVVDLVCGCDGNGDEDISGRELGVAEDACDTKWGCKAVSESGSVSFEIEASVCDGRYYLPDPECQELGDDSERDGGTQEYGSSDVKAPEESLSDAFAAPDEDQNFISRVFNFIF